MGFWDTASSVAGAAKSGIKSIKNTLTGQGSILNKMGVTYRNSLFYDFSSIIRAKIYVFDYKYQKSKDGIGKSQFTFLETLPVQLNPDKYKRIKGGSFKIDTEAAMNGKPHKDKDDSMDFTLDFNIVDEYKISTMDGTTPAPINLDEVTIISKLFKYQEDTRYRVLFKWGPLAFLSYISSVDCTYDSFSPFGEPLSATVNLILRKHKANFASNVDVDVNLETELGTSWTLIQGMDKAESIYESLKLSIQSSETLPNISKRIKD